MEINCQVDRLDLNDAQAKTHIARVARARFFDLVDECVERRSVRFDDLCTI